MAVVAFKLDGIETTPKEVRTTTLLDLVQAIVDTGASEREVVATVTRLVNSGRVQLVGAFRGADVRIA